MRTKYPRLRWIAVGIFVLSTTLNYLDRSLLNVLAPLIKDDLRLNNQQFGWLLSAFSICYAAASLPAGWLLDRIGVNRGISIATSLWSAASAFLIWCSGFGAVAVCRGILGIGESASVPGFGKINGEYLRQDERALGAAVNGIGLSLGPVIAASFIGTALHYGWRIPFVVSGLLGLLWLPLWWITARQIPTSSPRRPASPSNWAMLQSSAALTLMTANLLWMSGFSLWTNWVTIYLVEVHHLDLAATKSLVWIPSLVSNVGGLFGGWLSLHYVRTGLPAVRARQRAIWWSSIGCLGSLGLLGVHSAGAATAMISVSFFFVLSGSVNLYALPIDVFGSERAGLAVASLTFAYGIMQAIISPLIGWLGDHQLYQVPVWCAALSPVLASLLLTRLRPASVEL